MNLTGAVADYFERYCADHNLSAGEKEEAVLLCNNAIFPSVDPKIPAASYTGVNTMNLRNLFRHILKRSGLSNDDFRERCRPIITESLEHYMLEQYHDEAPLWGMWYKSEDYPGGKEECARMLTENDLGFSVFTSSEERKLKDLLFREPVPGELIGYALMLFAGATFEDLKKLRYSDIYEIDGYPGEYMLHMKGSFPKFSMETSGDVYPRFVPLPDELFKFLIRRKNYITARIKAPFIDTSEISFDDLPIACAGRDFTKFCTLSGLARAADELLRTEAGIEELRISLLNSDLLHAPAIYMVERTASLYMARRNYATMLFGSSVRAEMLPYLMGYSPKEAGCHAEINAADPANLHEAKLQIEQHIIK